MRARRQRAGQWLATAGRRAEKAGGVAVDRVFQPHRVLLALITVVLVTTGIELGLMSDSIGAPGTAPVPLSLTLTGLAGLLLFLHRQAPIIVLGLILVLESVLAGANAYPGGAPALVALTAVALYRTRRQSLAALLITVIVLQVASISAFPVPILAWAIGAWVQARMRLALDQAERAAQLEREREQQNIITVQTERTEIARELHDIIAHSVTVMLLGVRGARDTLRTDPDLAEEALLRVEKSGEASITELRRMLSVLRNASEAALAPAPTIGQIPELVRQYAESGMPVSLSTLGRIRPADAGIELTAYRVVQEGLTNVARHSQRPSAVAVTLTFEEQWLEISVTDNGDNEGRRPAPNGTGSGLPGLRERVVTVGGQLTVRKSSEDKGFQIISRLPLAEEDFS